MTTRATWWAFALIALGCIGGSHAESRERPLCDAGTWDNPTREIAETICEDEAECTVCAQASDATGKIVKWAALAGDCRCPPVERVR